MRHLISHENQWEVPGLMIVGGEPEPPGITELGVGSAGVLQLLVAIVPSIYACATRPE